MLKTELNTSKMKFNKQKYLRFHLKKLQKTQTKWENWENNGKFCKNIGNGIAKSRKI